MNIFLNLASVQWVFNCVSLYSLLLSRSLLSFSSDSPQFKIKYYFKISISKY